VPRAAGPQANDAILRRLSVQQHSQTLVAITVDLSVRSGGSPKNK